MKMAKAIRRQAVTAERVAANTADAFVAGQMKSLAQAFRTQAEIIKKKNKKKKKK
jgi:phosphotransacetylase